MKTKEEIQREITQLLTTGFDIIDNYLSAKSALNSYLAEQIATGNVYKGQCISKLLTTYFSNLAKKLTNRSKSTGRACFAGDELESICIGHIRMNEYDNELEAMHTVESIVNDCKFEELYEFIKTKSSKLQDESLTIAADNIIMRLELYDGHKTTGKQFTQTAKHFHLFNHLSYWNTYDTSQKYYALGNDLQLMSEHTGIDNCGQNFLVLSNDIHFGGANSRIPTNTKYTEGRGLLTVFKNHVKLSLSHEDFSALLAFIMSYKSKDVQLDNAIYQLKEVA